MFNFVSFVYLFNYLYFKIINILSQRNVLSVLHVLKNWNKQFDWTNKCRCGSTHNSICPSLCFVVGGWFLYIVIYQQFFELNNIACHLIRCKLSTLFCNCCMFTAGPEAHSLPSWHFSIQSLYSGLVHGYFFTLLHSIHCTLTALCGLSTKKK